MVRRLDGHKFEKEFSNTFEGDGYLLRLHTMNTGFSGLTQPADFILFRKLISFIETKETTKDFFSIANMEQLDEMKKFVEARKKNIAYRGLNASEYFVIVHFINRGVIQVITAEYALSLLVCHKTLKYNDPAGWAFTSLTQLKENLIL